MPAVLEQKITGLEAVRVRRRMAFAFGEPAPGAGGAPDRPAPATRSRPSRRARLLRPSPRRSGATTGGDHHPCSLDARRRSSASARSPPATPGHGSNACPGSAPGPRPRWPAWPGATQTPSASVTTTSPTWSPSPWPANRAAMTLACSSCWSRTEGSAAGSSACSSCPASGRALRAAHAGARDQRDLRRSMSARGHRHGAEPAFDLLARRDPPSQDDHTVDDESRRREDAARCDLAIVGDMPDLGLDARRLRRPRGRPSPCTGTSGSQSRGPR